jgi:hypothetical protein
MKRGIFEPLDSIARLAVRGMKSGMLIIAPAAGRVPGIVMGLGVVPSAAAGGPERKAASQSFARRRVEDTTRGGERTRRVITGPGCRIPRRFIGDCNATSTTG